MNSTLSAIVKQGLRTVGHYRRALSTIALPGVAVLCYHGVRDDATAGGAMPLQYLHVPESIFDAHCRLIRECCDPISLDDWRASLHGGAPLPRRPVLITFDDGYRSVLTKAAPILKAHRLPAAVFVCTGPMATGQRLWFDEIARRDGDTAVEAWKNRSHDEWAAACLNGPVVAGSDPQALMTAEDLRALASIERIEVGGHTVSHPILARASAATQREEIEKNLRTIEAWTGRRVRSFAYPNGRPGVDYTAETTAILRDNEIDVAFTTHPRFACSDEPPLERSRFFLHDDTSDAELAHRLTYSWPR